VQIVFIAVQMSSESTGYWDFSPCLKIDPFPLSFPIEKKKRRNYKTTEERTSDRRSSNSNCQRKSATKAI